MVIINDLRQRRPIRSTVNADVKCGDCDKKHEYFKRIQIDSVQLLNVMCYTAPRWKSFPLTPQIDIVTQSGKHWPWRSYL